MRLPRLERKALIALKTFYTIVTLVVFLPLLFYWVLGLFLTPAFILSFNSTHQSWLLGVSLMVLSGFALLCFLLLNLKVFVEKLSPQAIPKLIHIGIAIGCLLCAPLVIYFGLGLIPIVSVGCLYYLSTYNQQNYTAD